MPLVSDELNQKKQTSFPTILVIFLMIFAVGIVYIGSVYYLEHSKLVELTKFSEAQKTQIGTLQSENDNLKSSYQELKNENQRLITDAQTKKAITCSKENACKFRTPDSQFTCTDSTFDPAGKNICICDADCNVVMQ